MKPILQSLHPRSLTQRILLVWRLPKEDKHTLAEQILTREDFYVSGRLYNDGEQAWMGDSCETTQ